MKKVNKLQILTSLLFLSFAAWWLSFQHIVENQSLTVQWYGGTYGIMALLGAVIGFIAAKRWGGWNTILGKALTLYSLGLLAQEAGQLIYTYYIYGAKIQIPYPSWGDAAYFGSVLLYIIATIYLGKAAGIRFTLKRSLYRLVSIAVPAIILLISFLVFLHHHKYDTSHPLTVFLDFGYPIGQALYISLAINAYLLSRKMLGGVMRNSIFLIIIALTIQYISDFAFVYQSSRGIFLSGKIVDLFYLSSYFVMTIALIKFFSTFTALRGKSDV